MQPLRLLATFSHSPHLLLSFDSTEGTFNLPPLPFSSIPVTTNSPRTLLLVGSRHFNASKGALLSLSVTTKPLRNCFPFSAPYSHFLKGCRRFDASEGASCPRYPLFFIPLTTNLPCDQYRSLHLLSPFSVLPPF